MDWRTDQPIVTIEELIYDRRRTVVGECTTSGFYFAVHAVTHSHLDQDVFGKVVIAFVCVHRDFCCANQELSCGAVL